MSSSYRDDQEQLQIIKNWLREYGLVVVMGIVLAIAIVLGWHYWLQYQLGRRDKASTNYQQMVELVVYHKPKEAKPLAETLIAHYSSTPYAVWASLWLAQQEVSDKNYEKATDRLNWALKHSHDKPLNSIINIRLAKVSLVQGKMDEALKRLQPVKQGAFAGVAYEVEGDIYFAEKKVEKAHEAWKQALQHLPVDNAGYHDVQLKLANLPVKTSGEKE